MDRACRPCDVSGRVDGLDADDVVARLVVGRGERRPLRRQELPKLPAHGHRGERVVGHRRHRHADAGDRGRGHGHAAQVRRLAVEQADLERAPVVGRRAGRDVAEVRPAHRGVSAGVEREAEEAVEDIHHLRLGRRHRDLLRRPARAVRVNARALDIGAAEPVAAPDGARAAVGGVAQLGDVVAARRAGHGPRGTEAAALRPHRVARLHVVPHDRRGAVRAGVQRDVAAAGGEGVDGLDAAEVTGPAP